MFIGKGVKNRFVWVSAHENSQKGIWILRANALNALRTRSSAIRMNHHEKMISYEVRDAALP